MSEAAHALITLMAIISRTPPLSIVLRIFLLYIVKSNTGLGLRRFRQDQRGASLGEDICPSPEVGFGAGGAAVEGAFVGEC